MELISKIDIDGTFEVADSLRQIGVATSNITPDDKGEIALSKQNAMILETPSNGIQTGIISAPPISVASTNQMNELESINFSNVAPQIAQLGQAQAANNTQATQTSEAPKKIELPAMEDANVVAPDSVPAGLFIDNVDTNGSIKLENPMQGNEQIVDTGAPQDSEQLETLVDTASTTQSSQASGMPLQAGTVPAADMTAGTASQTSIFETMEQNQGQTLLDANQQPSVPANTNETLNNNEDVLKMVNDLFTSFENKQKEELEKFKENLLNTVKFMLNNNNVNTVNNVNNVQPMGKLNSTVAPPTNDLNKVEEVLSVIPSLDNSQPEIPQQAEQIPTFEFQNTNDLNAIDSEQIKPKFIYG